MGSTLKKDIKQAIVLKMAKNTNLSMPEFVFKLNKDGESIVRDAFDQVNINFDNKIRLIVTEVKFEEMEKDGKKFWKISVEYYDLAMTNKSRPQENHLVLLYKR